jgi:riboflavin biosynthesis pyrimidine reductase
MRSPGDPGVQLASWSCTPDLAGRALAAGLVDECQVFVAPILIGEAGGGLKR